LSERYHKENKFLRRKDRRLENDLNMLRIDHELLVLKYSELIKENQNLKLFQEQEQE